MIDKCLRTASAGLLACWLTAATLGGCLNEEGGTEIPNELTGREFLAGKGPAAGAEIRFIPVGFVPGDSGTDTARAPAFSARTDASGRFALKITVPGQYNILAMKDGMKSYRDSVTITGNGQNLGADTLETPGNLYGTVALQPNHDPRSATVHVLGTNLFVNAGADGSFLLPDLGPGEYRLAVSTIIEGYTTLHAAAIARAGRTDTLPILRPHYIRVPVVTGLRADANKDGTVTVRWDRTGYANADGYLVYRDTAGTILPSTSPVARVADTQYVDTVYSKTPRQGQYSELDTASHDITYRVRLLDRGGDPGPAYASATAKAYPPGKAIVSGKWTQGTATAAFGKRSGAVMVAFKDRLWLYGGMDADNVYKNDAWSSADGIAWTKERDSVPVTAWSGGRPITVFQGKLWALASSASGYDVYASADGSAWTKAAEGVVLPGTGSFDLAAFGDKLWAHGNQGTAQTGGIASSPDGIDWTAPVMPSGFLAAHNPGVAVFGGSLWRLGGLSGAEGYAPKAVWRTKDGETWTKAAESSPILPRAAFALLAAGPALYCIGGYQNYYDYEAGVRIDNDVSDQVWTSKDALEWTLVDSHAPFGKRRQPATAHFQGRIWLAGGASTATNKPLGDIWYMEAP